MTITTIRAIAAGLVLASAGALQAQQADTVAAALERAVARAEAGGFSGSVLVARGGEIVLQRSAGQADPALGVPNTVRTVFDVGSITKQFTRAGILALRDRGLLALMDTLGRFFPDAPPDKRSITLEQVIRMEAGFAEYVDRQGEAGDFADIDRAEALRRILHDPLAFPPGTDRMYSNAGYTLLALVIERVSGREYEAFVRSELLEPAGLTRTGFYHDQSLWDEADVAVGFGGRSYGEKNSPYHWPRIRWALAGNGGMVSSPAELYQWITALRSGRVLSADAYRDLYGGTPPTGPAPEGRSAVIYAGGSDFGFVSVVFELFDRRGIVIVTSNNGTAMPLGRALAEALLGKRLPMP